MTDDERAPPRLVQTQGPAGDCVRQVLSHQELLPAPPRFTLLQERRQWRVQRQRGLALLTLALSLVGVRALQQQEPLPDIRAERSVGSRGQPSAAVGLAPSAPLPLPLPLPLAPEPLVALSSSKPEAPSPVPLKAVAVRSTGLGLAPVDQRSQPPAGATSPRVSESAAGGGAKACAQLARDGASEQALACYAQLASGTGMSAELALFEQARLEGKALRHPERALLTLDDYRRRFPNGSLRAEVMLAQIDWLLASGNSPRALELVDEALASGLLRERTAELERLRGALVAAPTPRD